MLLRPELRKYSRFLENMPVIPSVAAEVLFMVGESASSDFETIEGKLALDPGLSARLLKIANSAAYGRSGQVAKVSTALAVIGFRTARSLILLVIGSRLFDKKRDAPFLKDYWIHTLLTAFFAQDLARFCGFRELADDAFTGSLLFHLGQVSFWLTEPDAYQSLIASTVAENRSLSQAENTQWGFDHRELGSALLHSWDFPPQFVDLAREHGKDNLTTVHKRLVRLVSVASFWARTSLNTEVELPKRVLLWLQELSLSEAQALAWTSEVGPRVRSDSLYRVCTDLLELQP